MKQLPKITDTIENFISEVGNNVSTMGKAQSEIVNNYSYRTKGGGIRRGTLKKRLETPMAIYKASILQARDTTAAESVQLEFNNLDDCSEKITIEMSHLQSATMMLALNILTQHLEECMYTYPCFM